MGQHAKVLHFCRWSHQKLEKAGSQRLDKVGRSLLKEWYPLVMTNSLLLKMTIEIKMLSFPIQNSFHSYVNVCQSGRWLWCIFWQGFLHGFPGGNRALLTAEGRGSADGCRPTSAQQCRAWRCGAADWPRGGTR